MKFYACHQNNSGGYFIDNDTVGEILIVQAKSPEEAEIRVLDIVENYSDYCECCGERWYISFDNEDGSDIPCDKYGREISKDTNFYGKNSKAVIHYLDGRIEVYNSSVHTNT